MQICRTTGVKTRRGKCTLDRDDKLKATKSAAKKLTTQGKFQKKKLENVQLEKRLKNPRPDRLLLQGAWKNAPEKRESGSGPHVDKQINTGQRGGGLRRAVGVEEGHKTGDGKSGLGRQTLGPKKTGRGSTG